MKINFRKWLEKQYNDYEDGEEKMDQSDLDQAIFELESDELIEFANQYAKSIVKDYKKSLKK